MSKLIFFIVLQLLFVASFSISYVSYKFSSISNSIDTFPSYPLGNLIANTPITINIQIVNTETGVFTNNLAVFLTTSTNTNPIKVFNCPSSFSCVANYVIPATGGYILRVLGSPSTFFIIYQVSVYSGTTKLFAGTDNARSFIFKYFYIATPGNYTISFTPAPTSLTLALVKFKDKYQIINGNILNTLPSTGVPGVYYHLFT
jgi:hypothetical protein